jgi:hypothetical protein
MADVVSGDLFGDRNVGSAVGAGGRMRPLQGPRRPPPLSPLDLNIRKITGRNENPESYLNLIVANVGYAPIAVDVTGGRSVVGFSARQSGLSSLGC